LKGRWESERDPLVALQAGDPALFEAFVRTEAVTFVGFFRRQGADRAEAEDLTQEVFVKLFRSAPKYRARSAFASYALRVARNAWVDRRRRIAAQPPTRSLSEAASPHTTAPADPLRLVARDPQVWERMSVSEESQRLREALSTLSPEHAIVFELAVVQRLPYADIASELGIPVGTVKSRVFSAVRKLRAAVEGEGERA
jgi:RNA polymerase sigma-70 factor (ECF subfamily)